MDSTETALLVGLGALSLGVLLGWHLRLSQRRQRAAGAMSTIAAAKKTAGPGAPVQAANRFNKPVGGSNCGCPS